MSYTATGDGTTAITFTVASSAKAGIYPIAVTAKGGGMTRTALISLTVASSQNFSFSVNTNAMRIQQGAAAGTVIVSTGNFTGGFDSTVVITFGGLVPGMKYRAMGATGSKLVNISVGITAASYTSAGTYPITITASGAGISYSAIVQITVTQPAALAKR
jgi:uncharacterized membrane protein